jgi:hypothetical protein
MSPHQQVALDANLGSGWIARHVEFVDSPSSIVLVTVERDADRRSLRLDVGKGMFLDEPPDDIDPRAAREVTNSILQVAPVPVSPRR